MIKIMLGNLKHKTIGRHSSFMPINIAYIASYVLDNISGVEIRLYDDADKMLKDIANWSPDIIGLSNYCWNSELSSIVFKYGKKNNPKVLTISGGPEFPEIYKECEQYLLDKKEIDFYVYREGEIAFLNLVKNFSKEINIGKLKQKYLDGTMSIDTFNQKIIIGKEIPRLKNLDIIPSPYLNNLLDPWFDGTHAPSIETTRGCPFLCQYCHTGILCYNKIGEFSLDRIKKELDYISKKMVNYSNILLSICDTNFGIYKKDKELIKYIKKLQKKYNWPLEFDVTTGKTKYNKILNIIKELGGSMRFDCAIQSMNHLTLDIIKRNNLDLNEYEKLQKEAKENGIISVAEFIAPLPEETKETCLNGLKNIMNRGVDYIYLYTTMLLKGAGLSTKENREKYNMKTYFRVLPRMFGEYSGEKCFEIEEVCVSTNTMSFEDYVDCRGFILISSLLGSDQVDIIPWLLKELGISSFDFINFIWEFILKNKTKISEIYNKYLNETKNELWNSKKEIYDFFSKPENYDKLLKGELGDNLIRKYKTKILLENYKDILDLCYIAIENLANKNITNEIRNFLRDSKKWLFYVRRVDNLLKNDISNEVTEISLEYDINEWYKFKNKKKFLFFYKKHEKYKIFYRNIDQLIEKIDQRKKLFGDDNYYNIGKLMMDGEIKFLWRDCEKKYIQ